jgi:monothiol glutaredoxin
LSTVALPSTTHRSFSLTSKRWEEKKKFEFPPRDPAVEPRVYKLITEKLSRHPVMVFMKGTPDYPKCGFSRLVVQILDYHGIPYQTMDVLEDTDLREGIKVFGNWPTIPQVYLNGELVGGADIMRGLHESGEVKTMFPKLEPAKQQ